VASLFDTIRDGLQEGARLPPEDAERIAIAVIEWGAETGIAGAEYYWPAKVQGQSLEQRNEAIRGEFDGTNLKAICQKYSVGKTTVYRAINN